MSLQLSKNFPGIKFKLGEDEDEEVTPKQTVESMVSSVAPIIYVRGIINANMAENFVRALEQLKQSKLDGCVIDISSPGGDVMALMQMLGAMRSCPNVKFVTYCSSHAYSAGAVLLACGSPGMRIMSPFSSAMIHSILYSVNYTGVEEHALETAFTEELNNRLLTILAKNMKGMNVEKLKKAIRKTGGRTWYLFPEEAKEVGLIDEIGIPDISVAPMINIQVSTGDISKVSKL